MPICPECSTGFDDEAHCPKCGAPSPVEVWPHPSSGSEIHKPDYGRVTMFCLHITRIFAFISIIWTIGLFIWHLFRWENIAVFLTSLISVPISIAVFSALGIAIRFANEKNGIR